MVFPWQESKEAPQNASLDEFEEKSFKTMVTMPDQYTINNEELKLDLFGAAAAADKNIVLKKIQDLLQSMSDTWKQLDAVSKECVSLSDNTRRIKKGRVCSDEKNKEEKCKGGEGKD
jgi:hypothetical protein